MKEMLHSVESEIEKRSLSNAEVADILSADNLMLSRRIIGGYASVDVVDRENQRIPVKALKTAVKNFMENPFYKPVMIFHSDIQVGRILPKWTHPKTGETFETHVDDTGWWVVIEIRDDIEVANKVWAEVKKGNILSFSIAGSSKNKFQTVKDGQSFEQINTLEIYECTLCCHPDTKIWTKTGLKKIKDIQERELVLTHLLNWKPVIKCFVRENKENLLQISTKNGCLRCTSEHPIRVLAYEGKHKGTHYVWKPAKDLKEGDLISYHSTSICCDYCGAPIFYKNYKKANREQRVFCDESCKYSASGNRKGSHPIRTKGITKKENPNLSGGIKTKEGLERNIAAHKTSEFRVKRSIIQKQKWLNVGYAIKQTQAQKRSPNKMELLLDSFLQREFPNEWKYVGDGKLWIEGKNPDFVNINGKKKVIELDGEYWHQSEEKRKARIKHFQDYGFEMMIITDKKLMREPNIVLAEIREFYRNELVKVSGIKQISYLGKVYNLEVADDNSFVTEIMVVHNCEMGVNPLSKFGILLDPNEVTV